MSGRTLAVILEATDGELVDRWLAEGRMPNLAKLAEEGSMRPIASAGEFIQEATLASALTGVTTGGHGAYGWRVTAPGTHGRVRMDEGTWSKAFWEIAEDLAPEARILLLDVTYGRLATGPRRTELRGWGMRVARQITSHPPELAAEMSSRFPPHPAWLNREYERSVREQRAYASTLVELAERRGDMALELLAREPWDLAAINFTEPHYGGHAYYVHERPDAPVHDPSRSAAVDEALPRVYEATDRQIGRLVDAVGPGTDVVVLSSMGMRVNECSRELLGEVLIALGYQVPRAATGRTGRLVAVQRLAKRALPRSVRHRIGGLSRSPAVLAAADAAWGESIDWERSRVVSDAEPGENWIRLNLEPDGGPVAAADAEGLIEEVTADLMQLTDTATGEPAVESIVRAGEIVDGPRVPHLPDLLLRWRVERPVTEVLHPRAGRISDPGLVPQAEHSSRGFLVAAGPRIARPEAGRAPAGVAEWDAAAVLLHLLGSPLPEELDGRVPADLLADGEQPELVSHPIATVPDALR